MSEQNEMVPLSAWQAVIVERMEERNRMAFMLGCQLVDSIVARTGSFDTVPTQFFTWYLFARVTELLQAECIPEPYEVRRRTAQDLRKLFEHADRIVHAKSVSADPAMVDLFMVIVGEAMNDLMMRPALSNEDLTYGGSIPAPLSNVQPVGDRTAYSRGP